MTTFRAVNDELLERLIGSAKKRIIFVAPGLHQTVARAIADRFEELDRLDVTLVLDASEDVCRIGFGEIEALKLVHGMCNRAGFHIRNQPGLRVGVLIADDQTLVWSPTPRAVEATPAAQQGDEAPVSPNGLLLGREIAETIARAICADGTDADPEQAEIGKNAVTPAQVEDVARILVDNPPIPVDLQRITRVFSTKLQFVELESRGASLSKRTIRLPNDLINLDANPMLQTLLDTGLKPFAEMRNRKVKVRVFHAGEQAFTRDGQPMEEEVTEAQLARERKDIEAEFLYQIPRFGTLLEAGRKAEFLRRLEGLESRMTAHATGIRAIIREETDEIIDEIVHLIRTRSSRSSDWEADWPWLHHIRDQLTEQIDLRDDEAPRFRCVFKGITYEQTSDPEFCDHIDNLLPDVVKERLGQWYEEFSAAKEGQAIDDEAKQ